IASLIPEQDDLGRDMALFDYFEDFGGVFGLFLAGILAAIAFPLVFAARGLIFLAIFGLIKMLPKHLEGHTK
ncbi:MAG: hypothetical protein V1811_02890, partial [Candidatus Micrarchaeota archaeon]